MYNTSMLYFTIFFCLSVVYLHNMNVNTFGSRRSVRDLKFNVYFSLFYIMVAKHVFTKLYTLSKACL